jgi:hypothetical protein
MCTLGSVVEPGRVLTFKQCDLPRPTRFWPPEIHHGRFAYLAFGREGGRGPWAGMNEHGVAFVTADAYLDREHAAAIEPQRDPFEGYVRIVAEHERAGEAVDAMISFYEEAGVPDILLVSDAEGAFLVEYDPRGGARVLPCSEGWIASANHFRMLPGAIPFEEDPSTYLRLARAEELLEEDASLAGIHKLLCDQHFGASERSICRVADREGDHSTQAAVVFRVEGGRVSCNYWLNGNVRTVDVVEWEDVFRR